MITYTLHKLKEGFIVTSNEEIQDVKPHYGKLHLEKGHILNIFPTYLTDLSECKLVIAQQDKINFSNLSEEEQKEIGWFDVEKLAVENNPQIQLYKNDSGLPKSIYVSAHKNYREGFQKAQELLSDRMFTLEDMKNCWQQAIKSYVGKEKTIYYDEFIQSLSQPKSWNVEGYLVGDVFNVTKIK